VSTPATGDHQSPAHPGADHITPYDRFVWEDEEIEGLLASGEQREELEAFFGRKEYRELARLAGVARRAPIADAYPTLIVPGIMGSQLGIPRPAPQPRDILWLDPVDIGFGRLSELALPGAVRVRPYGIVLYSYLRLKLHLRAVGMRALFHAYDWRLGVDMLGHELAQRLRAEPSAKVALVAHSMGGIVSRAALAHPGGEKVARLVLLGSPNFGSYAPVLALRGCYSVVRKIAQLDLQHTPEALSSAVFNTFPSLYHMLPHAGLSGTLDLLDPKVWPRARPQPVPALLESARSVQRALPPLDARCLAVVGVGAETVTAVQRRGDEFVYTVTRHGDGTVPVASARLPGGRNFHAAVSHSELSRDRTIAAAVVDLLRTGSTRRLRPQWCTTSAAQARISDRELNRRHIDKVDWAHLTSEQRRVFLENLNEPPKLRLRIPARARRHAGLRARSSGL